MIKEKLKPCPKHKVQFFSFYQDKDSVLNTPEGRKILHDVGIQTPYDVGDWLIDVFRNHLDQEELAERYVISKNTNSYDPFQYLHKLLDNINLFLFFRLKDYIHKEEEPSKE